MRGVKKIFATVLLSAAVFHSCTCQNTVPPASTSSVLKEASPGFHAAVPSKTAALRAAAPTLTPAAEQVAAAPTATVAMEIPSDFPVPVFQGAALAKVQSLANDAHNVIFRSSAPANDLYNFYQDKLTRDGWKVSQQFQRGKHAFMSFQKGDMVANVTIAEDVQNPGQQVLAIMYEKQKPLEFDEF